MSNLMELRQAAEYDAQNKMQANPLYGLVQGLGAGFNTGIAEEMKRQQDEKRRQENVKKQMSQAQEMMKQMSQMPDNSSSGKAIGTLDNDTGKQRKGIISVSDYVPQQEMTYDENGALNLKFGYRRATPQEQKAQFDTKKAQIDQEKAMAKSDLLSAYAQGKVQEGAILGEMATLGITPDEFDMASQARERFRQISQQQAVNILGGQPIQNVQTQPMAQAPQPQEQPFRFKPQQASETKAIRDMASEDKANALKSQGAIDNAESAVSAIDHLQKNVNYFGGLEGRIAPVFPGKIEFNKNYEYLKAKNILNILSELKSQSRTGATGFGAMNEKELKLIQDAAQRLDVTMDEKTAGKYLNEMKQSFQKIIDRERNGYQSEGGNQDVLRTEQSSVLSVGGTFNGEKVISVKRIR